MKYLVYYSGEHSSALAIVEVFDKNVILLNCDISSAVEVKDTKRFIKEVAGFS